MMMSPWITPATSSSSPSGVIPTIAFGSPGRVHVLRLHHEARTAIGGHHRRRRHHFRMHFVRAVGQLAAVALNAALRGLLVVRAQWRRRWWAHHGN